MIRAYLRAGRTAEGLKLATDLSAQNKDNVQLHFTLGVLLASEKQYRVARLELEKANALQPETFEILYNLGQAYLRCGEYAKAELALNRALKLKSDSPETLYLLAQVYQEQNRSVDALDLLVRAHKLAPQNTDIIFLLARVSMTQNYFEDAIPLLESGLKIAPQRADLHAALGESYFMSGKSGKSHRGVQIADRTGSLGTILCVHGAFLPASWTIRRSQKIFSRRSQAGSSQRFLPIQHGLHRGAPGKSRASRGTVSGGAALKPGSFRSAAGIGESANREQEICRRPPTCCDDTSK